jgi:hypothetical protein
MSSDFSHWSVPRSNRVMVFRTLHTLGPIAGFDLAQEYGLDPGTVANIVNELMAPGWANEIQLGDPETPAIGEWGHAQLCCK